MAKEDAMDFLEGYYAHYLSVAQQLVTTIGDSNDVQSISPEALLEVIHHSIALGLVVGGLDFLIDDKEVASDIATEYYNIYADQLSQFIPIQKNDKD